jgi:hypothetical protein
MFFAWRENINGQRRPIDMKVYCTKPADLATGDDIERRYPIIARHYGFAEEAAASAFGRRWQHPSDRDFTDRPPPGAPATAKPKPPPTLDVVSALLAKKRRAA